MTPSNKASLETFRHILKNRGGAGNLNEVLRIVREEWDPGYTCDMWCDYCKMKLIDYAFGMMAKTDTITVDFENNFPNNINS